VIALELVVIFASLAGITLLVRQEWYMEYLEEVEGTECTQCGNALFPADVELGLCQQCQNVELGLCGCGDEPVPGRTECGVCASDRAYHAQV
jgi:hypothetical protein